jgi:dolichyl-phosphooligosaccharide-protein glycotransferase
MARSGSASRASSAVASEARAPARSPLALPRPRLELLLLLALVLLAFGLRVIPAYSHVFTPDGVVLDSTDPWYHLRRVDTMVANFPHAGAYDPYLAFPGARDVPTAPLYDLAIASVALLLGLGHPSDALVAAVAAWTPALLGALAVLPVFFLARRLWGPTAALVAGALVATMPGHLLRRSLLGHTDHHVAEALLVTTAMASLAWACDAATPWSRRWRAALAGVTLAAYQLTWRTAWAFVLLLAVWLAVQWLSDTLRGRAPEVATEPLLAACLVATLMVVPFVDGVTVSRVGPLVALAVALLAALLLATSRVSARLALPRPAVVAIAVGAGIVAAAAFAALAPRTVHTLLLGARRLAPDAAAETVAEVRPLLPPGTAWRTLWQELALAPVLAVPGLAVLLDRTRRSGRPAELLVLVTATGLGAAAFLQQRFAYYLAVPVALLAGLAASSLLARFHLLPEGEPAGNARRRGRAVAVAATLALTVVPALRLTITRAAVASGPGRDWLAALDWLRTKTPEPFGDPAAYRARCPGDERSLQAPAFTVLAWWDFGYWLTAVAHRVPVANPTQTGARETARFFLAEDETEADVVAHELDARYVVADASLPMLYRSGATAPSGRLGALAMWLGVPKGRLFEAADLPVSGGVRSVALFYPAYFRSMAVRMATFAGLAVRPAEACLVTFEPPTGPFRRIRSLERFGDAAAAAAELARRDPAVTRLASTDPLRPCVPLERLTLFREVQRSTVDLEPNRPTATVRVFQRVPGPTSLTSLTSLRR